MTTKKRIHWLTYVLVVAPMLAWGIYSCLPFIMPFTGSDVDVLSISNGWGETAQFWFTGFWVFGLVVPWVGLIYFNETYRPATLNGLISFKLEAERTNSREFLAPSDW